MRNIFPGFYKRDDEEFSKLWQEGIFVFDTNMLLNVYRYTQKTRNRYFEILDLLKQRNQLWIPYQVAYEYQDRRLTIIQSQLDAYKEVTTILQTTAQKLETSLSTYHNKHEFIHTEKLIEDINEVINKAKKTVTHSQTKDKREFEALKKNDNLLIKLEELFQDNIGDPYTGEKLHELYRQAQFRIELKIPPGWEDEDKKGFKKYGDIILWFQLLDFARNQKKPIIFVTDDGKKDWWIRDPQGKPIAPLPELIQEMYIEAYVLLHMYQGYNFIDTATHFFKLQVQPDIIEEAEKVSEQNALEVAQAKFSPKAIVYQGIQAEEAVIEWLREEYKIVRTERYADTGIDFFIEQEDLDTVRIGVIVKYKIERFFEEDMKRILQIIDRRKRHSGSIMLVLVCSRIDGAKATLLNLKRYGINRSDILIRVGYITSFGYFREINDIEE
jgi:PIN like domain